MTLRRFIIERDIPSIGSMKRDELRGAAAKSNEVNQSLGSDIQWVESYVAADKTFCVYLATIKQSSAGMREISGFPATKVSDRSPHHDRSDNGTGRISLRSRQL